uniref:mitochondrial inner membrane protein OXA1L-like isoform X2 n=1 Tax=Myxine glutinosa TaxID=7769 RepID=UPI00358F5DBB
MAASLRCSIRLIPAFSSPFTGRGFVTVFSAARFAARTCGTVCLGRRAVRWSWARFSRQCQARPAWGFLPVRLVAGSTATFSDALRPSSGSPSSPTSSVAMPTLPAEDLVAVTEPLNGGITADISQVASPLCELRLEDLGLGGYSPVGVVQNLFEMLHMNAGLPWWGAIAVGTLLLRIIVFPMIVKGQRETVKLTNVMPQMTLLQEHLKESKRSGNMFEYSKAQKDLISFMKKNDVNPLRGFLVPLVQVPVFLSTFIALRRMAELPVPSLSTGGCWWFQNLAAADPYYVLPVITAVSMMAVMEMAIQQGTMHSQYVVMTQIFRVLPFVMIPFFSSFPTAIFMYWITSNCISILQVGLLNVPAVRHTLKIPEKTAIPQNKPPQQGFLKSLQKGWEDAKDAYTVQERERHYDDHLEKAAKAPLRQTWVQNPLHSKEASVAKVRSKSGA